MSIEANTPIDHTNPGYCFLIEQTSSAIFSVVMGYVQGIPQQVLDAEAQAFTRASKMVRKSGEGLHIPSYVYEGQEDYHFEDLAGSYTNVIDAHLASSSHRPYRLLDIGTGSGLFCAALEARRGKSFEASGISASDLHDPRFLPHPRCYVGDATKLLSNPTISSQKWDCIVSFSAIYLLIDNARMLADYYSLLDDKGILIFDELRLRGLNGQIKDLFAYLNKQGYECYTLLKQGHNDKGETGSLIIRKTHPALVLPFTYDANTPLVTLYNHSTSALYQAAFPTSTSKEQRDALLAAQRKERKNRIDICKTIEIETIAPPSNSALMTLLNTVGLTFRTRFQEKKSS